MPSRRPALSRICVYVNIGDPQISTEYRTGMSFWVSNILSRAAVPQD
jgi:hypothetical protein